MTNTKLAKYISDNIGEAIELIFKFREKNDDVRTMKKIKL
jgi:hypothetical protein